MAGQLNAGQQRVRDSRARRVVVSAGAGSGKTRVLAVLFVDRVLGLEAAGAPDPMRSVLLITFTEKAAGELVERVRGMLLEAGRPDLARQVDDAWISTIHGFCNRIVRRHALELGVDPAFGVLDETAAGIARLEAFDEAAVSLLDDPDVRALLDAWSVADCRDSVMRAYDALRSKGATVDLVAPSVPGRLDDSLQHLLRVSEELLPEYRELQTTDTILSNTALFEGRAAAARELLAELRGGCDPTGAGIESVAVALTCGKGKLSGSARMKELTASLNEAAWGVRRALLDQQAAKWSRAWLRLLAAFDSGYATRKSAIGALDFEDMQLLARRLWSDHPAAADRYRSQFAAVFVDEYQDTNPLQDVTIASIVGGDACYVGDVQQCIYGFRDAEPRLLRDRFDQAGADPEGEACRLTVNYRTHPDVLVALNAIFAHPALWGDGHQPLEHEVPRPSEVTWPEGEPRVALIVADRDECDSGTWRDVEAHALARRLRALVDQGRARARDIVVLTRATTTMGHYVRALEAVGFDVIAPSAGGFYATREVSDARALLSVLANPLDTPGVLGLLAGGLGGLSDDALFLLAETRPDRHLWAALEGEGAKGLPEADAERARLIFATVESLRRVQGRVRLADTLLYAAEALGPGGGLFSQPSGRANFEKVARLAAAYERTTPADPGAFLEYLNAREEYVKKESVGAAVSEDGDAVRIMTVHAAKGLEFPIVAVADLGHGGATGSRDASVLERDGQLVAALRGPKDLRVKDVISGSSTWEEAAAAAKEREDEEEKRVFYVACTRAEQALFLAGSARMHAEKEGGRLIDLVLTATRGGSAEGVSLEIVDGRELEGPDAVRAVSAAADEATPREQAASAPMDSSTSSTPAATPEQTSEPRLVPQAFAESGPLDPPREMSYTAFAQYEACAYRFFVERMLKVGSLQLRGSEDPLAFGSALHALLELLARGEDVSPRRQALLGRSAGLGTEEVSRLAAAFDAVVSSEVAALITKGRPEVDFALHVGDVVLRGSMDLLLTEGNTATVLDYKSGHTWDNDGDRYVAQAEVYALALLAAGIAEVTVRFVHVEAGCEEVAFRFGHDEEARIRARLEGALARMAHGSFRPLREFSARYCPDCPVSGSLCPVVRPGTRARWRN